MTRLPTSWVAMRTTTTEGPTVTEKTASATRFVPVPAQQIFDLLADPAMHPVLDGSGSVRQPLPGAPARLSMGADFGMSMKIGMPYRVKNTVVAFDEPHHIAWKHFGPAVWDYKLVDVPGGTQVTETWDYSGLGMSAKVFELLGFTKRNQKSMEATLERIERHVTTGTI